MGQIECERLDLQYEVMKVLFGRRDYFAPLKNPRKILDIGTGTGKWAMEMGSSTTILAGRMLTGRSKPVSRRRSMPLSQALHGHSIDDTQVTGTDLSPIQPEWYVQHHLPG